MEEKYIKIIGESSVLKDLYECRETVWINPEYKAYSDIKESLDITKDEIIDAEKRLIRFAPYIAKAFPETAERNGIIESPLKEIPAMKECIAADNYVPGKLFLKQDSELKVAGSVKARGGIYEVLKHAEALAVEKGMLSYKDDYSKLCSREFKEFFGGYTIQVGSTGNLGLSIGIMGSALGFNVIVHMSSDAKQWKKDLLRKKGVKVIEYETDYSAAVKKGREMSKDDKMSFFIDDENSVDLFLGYAVAAGRLKKQLEDRKVRVDEKHPLIVYIPCGVGGAPGGITYGLKMLYGDNVHCFFVEPVNAPCMALGLATGYMNKISVKDFGISGKTEADGLAVGRPSRLVSYEMKNILSGEFTVDDSRLNKYLKMLYLKEGIFIEPSSCAAFIGPAELLKRKASADYVNKFIGSSIENCTQIVWATGGSLVPEYIRREYLS